MGRFLFLMFSLANAAFVPGAVCDGVDVHGSSISMLAGKHLRINELEWAPFAFKDAASPHGWSGFDIDLLRKISGQLGFTFEVHEASKLPSESRWTDTYAAILLEGSHLCLVHLSFGSPLPFFALLSKGLGIESATVD